jgi:NADPH-dependent glutamate synthase beta subunit-like oxidoreductase
MPVRKINVDDCIGCGACVEACPMDVFRLETSDKHLEVSPCSNDCPLGLNQREYHNLIKMGMLGEAVETIQARHPMPSITGRICPHPCENNCTRGQVDVVININGLEQYLGDYMLNNVPAAGVKSDGDKVAVIGSGPAGLAAAYQLARKGYQVTVFEKDAEPGGLLRYSVPAFRLSTEILDKQIDYYKSMGIEFRTGISVGKDVTKAELEGQGFKAVIAATGSTKPLILQVPGADANNVSTAIKFLKDSRTGNATTVAERIAVIGGGSVSLDAARTALRLGAKEVHVICLERIEFGHKDSMLALAEEIEEAKEEGVIFHVQRSVKEFTVKDGAVVGAQLVECSSVRNEDRTFNPICGVNVIEELDIDGVIMAIGQTADAEIVPVEFATSDRGFIKANSKTLRVGADMFAAGDGVTGPTTVVRALASGSRAALVVDRYLKGEDLEAGLDVERPMAKDVPTGNNVYLDDRQECVNAPAEVRLQSFDETMPVFTPQQAQRESERCLTCGSRSTIAYIDDCQVCRLCAHYCPADCIEITDGAYMTSLHNFDVVTLGKALNN